MRTILSLDNRRTGRSVLVSEKPLGWQVMSLTGDEPEGFPVLYRTRRSALAAAKKLLKALPSYN